ncbi:MAG: integrase arm-type DNA-binding domain-containing protein [Alphaproteobacteria bacterium]|nr:integrase arm-type DNA-binding domain-containing protein [Alphaproteobacteria bacterium]
MGAHVEKKLKALDVKRKTKPGRYADGGGLYLTVTKSGSKSWTLRVMVAGKAQVIGLGSIQNVSLAEAREKAAKLRKIAKGGGDPRVERDGKTENTAPTFAEAAHKVFDEHNTAWKNPKHRQQWINTMETYAFPVIGDQRVDEIGSDGVLEVLQPIWLTKPETARRVRQRMRAVFDWCLAMHFREAMNPVDAVRKALPRQTDRPKHHAALPHIELPAFLAALEASPSHIIVKTALAFLIHTAARTGEVTGASWSEIDDEKMIWTVPAERMKSGVEHRVPLAEASLTLLDQAKSFRGRGRTDFIFPGRGWRKPLSNMAMAMAVRRVDFGPITVHGFRSSFRDWSAEQSSASRDVCEAALAHTIRDKVEAAYRRTDLFEKRCELMAQWSRFLTSNSSELRARAL